MNTDTPTISKEAREAAQATFLSLPYCHSGHRYVSIEHLEVLAQYTIDIYLAAKDAELERLKEENRLLREGCSKIAASIGNGSAISPNASVDFLTNALADEVKLVCSFLRQRLNKAEDERDQLRQHLNSHCGCEHDGRGNLVAECQEHEEQRKNLDTCRQTILTLELAVVELKEALRGALKTVDVYTSKGPWMKGSPRDRWQETLSITTPTPTLDKVREALELARDAMFCYNEGCFPPPYPQETAWKRVSMDKVIDALALLEGKETAK